MAAGIYIHKKQSKEHIAKRVEKLIGQKRTVEQKQRMVDSHKGYKMPESQKQRLRELQIGTKQSAETVEKRVAKLRGRKRTIEQRKRISLSKIGMAIPWLTGKNNPNWRGGISKIDRLCRRMREYYKWRSDVFTRDNWTCQTCGITGVYVTAHHKIGFSKIIKENGIKNQEDARKCKELWDTKNGVTLCEECHKLTDNYKGRAKTT